MVGSRSYEYSENVDDEHEDAYCISVPGITFGAGHWVEASNATTNLWGDYKFAVCPAGEIMIGTRMVGWGDRIDDEHIDAFCAAPTQGVSVTFSGARWVSPSNAGQTLYGGYKEAGCTGGEAVIGTSFYEYSPHVDDEHTSIICATPTVTVATVAACGTATTQSWASAPNTNLCASGSSSTPYLNCSYYDGSDEYIGPCGTLNGGVNEVTEGWLWNCGGSGGVSCSAVYSAPTTVNGVCGAIAETCSSGAYTNSPADTSMNYQWTCNGSGSPVGTSSGTCTAPLPTPVTTFTGTYGAQVNQTTIDLPAEGGTVNLNWSITNGAGGGSCTGYSTTTGIAGWSTAGTGNKPVTGTDVPVSVASTTRFDLDCWNGNGTAAGRKQVQVNVAAAVPTLTVCPAAGATIYVLNTSSFTAWYNASGATNCSSTGTSTNVTSDPSTSWSSDNSSRATVSGGAVTGVAPTPPSTPVHVNASYSGLSKGVPITVINSCVTSCTAAQGANVCTGQTYSATNSCGQAETCNGSRSCNFNWQEMAP